MARFEPRRDLDQIVAARFLRPAVDRTADRLLREVQATAVGAKTWVTLDDDRVRNSHRHIHGVTIPANVPYIVPRPDGKAGTETAMAPRDPALSIGNRINCRCVSLRVPTAVKESMHRDPTLVHGTTARAEVWTRYTRAAESEFEQEGGHWFRDAINAVARAR